MQQRLKTDIPIPIFYFFCTTLCILKFQLMTQLVLKLTTDIIIYNQKQRPKSTGNILLMLHSNRWLVVFILCILLSNKKSIIKVRNSKHAKNGKRNWNSSTGSVIEIFKYAKVPRGNRN